MNEVTLKLFFDGDENNVTIRFFKNYVNHIETSINECDFIVSGKMGWGNKNSDSINQVLNSYGSEKKVVCFLVSDYEYDLQLPKNFILFKTSTRRKLIKKNEFVLPYIFEPHLGDFQRLSKTEKPIIGFCGFYGKEKTKRRETCETFQTNLINTNYLIRHTFWGGKPNDPELIKDFRKNILDSHFTISNRGNGNFSMRFYQVLSLGRIPILLDDDMVFPFENEIEWKNFIFIEKSPEELYNSLINYWFNSTDEEIIERQKKCYDLYYDYFSFDGYGKKIEKILTELI